MSDVSTRAEIMDVKKLTQQLVLALMTLQKAHDAMDDMNAGIGGKHNLCRWCRSSRYTGDEGIVHELDCVLREIRRVLALLTADESSTSARKQFSALAASWREATAFLSSPSALIEHEECQQIIAMGPRVLPYVLEDMEKNDGDWYIVLRALAKQANLEPPQISLQEARSSRAVRAIWLEWGRKNGFWP